METYVNICTIVFCIIGFVIKICGMASKTKDVKYGSSNTTTWGYGMILMSLIMQMLIRFRTLSNESGSKFYLFVPYLLVILLLLWNISLNFTYSIQINTNKVPKGYNGFSILSFIFFLIQIIILSVQHQRNELLRYVNYLLTTINAVMIIMMNILLKYFTTDG